MATFVLLHGSWQGGWAWQRVRRLLAAAGHEVHAPTLTGLGERSHLATPETGLAVHIEDVVRLLEGEDLSAVVLVGHSYSGLVVSGVAEAVPERLSRLVYLDAFVPADGQSAFDLMPVPGIAEQWIASAREHGGGWLVPPLPPESLGVTDPADAAWVRSRLTPMPLRTHQEPVRLPADRARELPRSYVLCVGYPLFHRTARRCERQGWPCHRLETGHSAMITAPEALAGALLAERAGAA
ncbi:MAG TPA: alpha/beta fold hydrolase [Thermoanaerobaculia bacterium]|jgi:pimeloyl-ACP methyl ester carboxylesterase|nr:alpha/beta fold hydrolase [Thermoanaerobaculia bacterium]